jgi:signal transduction histidine kinase
VSNGARYGGLEARLLPWLPETMHPPFELQARIGLAVLSVTLIPYSIVMALVFHLDGPSPEAVGVCLATLLPTIVVVFLVGHALSRYIYAQGAENMRLYREEQQRGERLAQLNELRSDFVSSASHELRGPLSSLLMFLEGLTSNWDRMEDGQRREIVRRTLEISRRMNRVVGDLLFAVERKSGNVLLDLDALAVAPLVEQARAEVATVYRNITIEARGDLGCRIMADATRVQQVLVNLLENAAKYCDPADPVQVDWERCDGQIVVDVSNRGPALAREEIEVLFQPFTRIPIPGRTTSAGLGLGLHVSKRLVEAMGGRIWAESGPSEMVFSFSLPAVD